MNIYVCVKHVPDSAATIVVTGKNRIKENITFLMNPYDEHALTEAGKLKNNYPDARVIAVCLGPPQAEKTLRTAMAMGADRAILIQTDGPCDSILTARALKAAIDQDGIPTLILTGKEAIDTEGMQTMFRLAANFNMPAAVNVTSLAFNSEGVRVECERESGAVDVMQLRVPCVIAAGRGLNTPIYPTLPGIMQARKKEVRCLELSALKMETPVSAMEVRELQVAEENREPKALSGTPRDIARQIVHILKDEAKVI